MNRFFANLKIALTFAVHFVKKLYGKSQISREKDTGERDEAVEEPLSVQDDQDGDQETRIDYRKDEAQALFKKVSAMIDKLAKKNIIHWKKAANQKSKLAKRVNALA